jgi:hypothetical protein
MPLQSTRDPQRPAPAPTLTEDGRCTECKVIAVMAGKGEMKVCPKCYALLWHAVWARSKERERAAATERADRARATAERSFRRAKVRTVDMKAVELDTSPPSVGAPTLKENKE